MEPRLMIPPRIRSVIALSPAGFLRHKLNQPRPRCCTLTAGLESRREESPLAGNPHLIPHGLRLAAEALAQAPEQTAPVPQFLDVRKRNGCQVFIAQTRASRCPPPLCRPVLPRLLYRPAEHQVSKVAAIQLASQAS